MGKFFVRITIVLVAIYFIVSYYMAQFYGTDILYNSYTLLFELCVLMYTFCEGKYHCKFIKWTMLSIFISDVISHLDYYIDFIPVGIYNYVCSFVLFFGFGTSLTLAIKHFYKVNKLKYGKRKNRINYG
jgi:hypothetical protein